MDLVDLLRTLVAIDSTSTRSNLPVVDVLERAVQPLGFVTRRLDWTDANGIPKTNLVCRRGPDEPGGLALVGHTDCVPFDPEWKEALAPAVRDGKVFGPKSFWWMTAWQRERRCGRLSGLWANTTRRLSLLRCRLGPPKPVSNCAARSMS